VPTPAAPPVTPFTYLDATSGAGGNTTLADGSTFTPPLNGTTGTDNNWEQRTVLGASGNIFEAGGEAAENAPEIRTTISGLIPGANYFLYAFFWDATGTTENWSLRAGFTAAPGANQLFSAADATGILTATAAVVASTLTYSSAPSLFVEANRVLQAAAVGAKTADGSGTIRVFLDDKPSTIAANNRTWYDGLAYTLAPATTPPVLLNNFSDGILTLAWPATHSGWRLQAQSNSLGTNWLDVAGSTLTNRMNFPPTTAVGGGFYRLIYP
jgi:hypothetical protein